jgi:hypothetical protein
MTRYRKLPGRRRGFIKGSSVWIGDDHLLLVKSTRFREEYKRFHLRDIQAVAVARAPRFHISTRALLIGVLWVIAYRTAELTMPFPKRLGVEGPPLGSYFLMGLALLAGAWIYISASQSCRCRIYTAVSADDLPSVYRMWTARKFLAKIEPKIAEAQGVLEGQWAEAAESRNIGPPLVQFAAPGAAPAGAGEAAPGNAAAGAPLLQRKSHTMAADLLVAVLFASGLVSLLMPSASVAAAKWPTITFMVLKAGLALAIFVEHYNGKLQGGMQKLAIATLMALGLMFYAEQLAVGFQAGAAAANRRAVSPLAPVISSGNRFIAEVGGGINLILGCVGLGIIVLSKENSSS